MPTGDRLNMVACYDIGVAQTADMAKPSVSMPSEMTEEIFERRDKAQNRSEYIRETLLWRFRLEDEGLWPPEDLLTDF